MIIFGYRSTHIAQTPLSFTTCEHCETKNSFTLHTYGRYFHVFWIPFFPIGKTKLVECSHCKKTYKQKEFSPEIRKSIATENIRNQAKTPIWHGIGCVLALGLILLLVLSIVIGVSTSDGPDTKKLNAERPYKDALDMDLAKLSSVVDARSDSVTYYLKECLTYGIIDEIKTDEIEYYTEIQGDKMLILLKVRDIKKIKARARKQLVELIEECLHGSENINEFYIGVKGKWTTILVKAPQESDLNGRIANIKLLYPFYYDLGLEPDTLIELDSDTLLKFERESEDDSLITDL